MKISKLFLKEKIFILLSKVILERNKIVNPIVVCYYGRKETSVSKLHAYAVIVSIYSNERGRFYDKGRVICTDTRKV